MKSQKGGRKASSLPLDTVEYLKAWMMSPEHIAHPYPTEQEKAQIMAETGIEMKQLTNWFVNNRKRFWKPRVEQSAQFIKKSIANAPSPRAHPSSNKNDGQLGIANHRPKRNMPEKQATSFLPSSSGSSTTRGRGGRASSFGKPSYIQEVDDTHPISDGSSYSQSDDDSLGSGGNHRSTNFGVIAQQYLDSLAKANSSSTSSAGKRKDEEVEVLILRPESSTSNGSTDSEDSLPTIRDVTIRSSAPEKRILASFKCHISYTIPKEIEHDKKKVQTRRDGEVLKIKKHYLKLYLATRGIHSVSTPPTGSDAGINAGTVSSASSVSSMTESTSSTRQTNAISPVAKRTHVFGKEEEIIPRKRARTLSGSFVEGEEAWKELCTQAAHPFSDSLPSMEEASRMFGYVSSEDI